MVATAARKTTARKTAIKPGTTFSATHADSSSLFTVVKARGADTYDCEIKAHPEYGTQIDWLGHKKVFGGEEIRRSIAQTNLFARLHREADDFWASRKVGEIVHYHNGFGQYVRGIIEKTAKGMQMRPTALVGAWRDHDLPKRGMDGEVRLPYHVKQIRNGEHFTPNDGSMWESKNFSGPMGPNAKLDPTTAPALDISDPAPLKGEAAKAARYEKLRMDMGSILSNGYNDPKTALITVWQTIGALLEDDLK
jgi:hypothetical protein